MDANICFDESVLTRLVSRLRQTGEHSLAKTTLLSVFLFVSDALGGLGLPDPWSELSD